MEITSDYIYDIFYEITQISNFIWVMNYDTLRIVRYVKDPNGNFLLKPGTPLKYHYGILLGHMIGIDESMQDNKIKTIKI